MLEIRKLSPFGAEILGVDLRDELSAEDKKRILEAWYREGVVVFRQEGLTEPDLDRIARVFGQPSYAGIADKTEAGHRQYISNVERHTSNVPDGELKFHMGYSFDEHPLRCTMLYGFEVPPPGSGGDTLFANAKLAYDRLPPALREKVNKLKIVHTKPQDVNYWWAHPINFPH